MDTELDALATALYVTTDDALKEHPEVLPDRPDGGFDPVISDSELITLAVIAALLGFAEERRFLRFAYVHLTPWFPYLPGQSGYNKRLRKLGSTLDWMIGFLARSTSV